LGKKSKNKRRPKTSKQVTIIKDQPSGNLPTKVDPAFQPTPDQQKGDTSEIVARLQRIPNVDVIVTNTEPEALLFITPILKKMKKEYGSKIHIHVTTPANPSFLDLIDGLQSIEEIHIHPKLDQKDIEKLEKKNGNVIMFNFLAALQQTVNRGLSAAQGMAALTQIVLNQIESLETEVALSVAAKKAALTIYGEGYIAVCPEFIAAIDHNYCIPRMWDRNKWLEVTTYLQETYGRDVVVLSFANGREPVLPQGVYDDIISVVSDNAEEVAAILSNADLVLGIDAAFVQIAKALGKPIVHIHSGGPISWSSSLYPMGDPRDGSTRILAAIDVNVITVDDVKKCVAELIKPKTSIVSQKEQNVNS
jgi:hypothetical protein